MIQANPLSNQPLSSGEAVSTALFTLVGNESTSQLGSLNIAVEGSVTLQGNESAAELGSLNIQLAGGVLLNSNESISELGSLGVTTITGAIIVGNESTSELGSLSITLATTAESPETFFGIIDDTPLATKGRIDGTGITATGTF